MTAFFWAAAALAILSIAVLAYAYDRARGRAEIQRWFLEAYMVKALRDRRHVVRIPAAALRAAFQLRTRALPDPSLYNQKPGPHPATRRGRGR